MQPIKQILILTLLTFIFAWGCEFDPDDPTTTTTTALPTTTSIMITTTTTVDDMYCENMYSTGQCTDGSWPQACVSYDETRCGYKVKGVMFYCARCTPYVDCEDAARAGVTFCYYSSYGEWEAGDSLIDTDELIGLFLNELERLQ